MGVTGVRFVYYVAGTVIRADHAREAPDGAYISEHPELGPIVFRARTERYEPVPSRERAHA